MAKAEFGIELFQYTAARRRLGFPTKLKFS